MIVVKDLRHDQMPFSHDGDLRSFAAAALNDHLTAGRHHFRLAVHRNRRKSIPAVKADGTQFMTGSRVQLHQAAFLLRCEDVEKALVSLGDHQIIVGDFAKTLRPISAVEPILLQFTKPATRSS